MSKIIGPDGAKVEIESAGKIRDLKPFVRRSVVQTILIELTCPECKLGDLVYSGKMAPQSPKVTMYEHKCSKCGLSLGIANKQFPRPEYQKIPAPKNALRAEPVTDRPPPAPPGPAKSA